MKKILLVIQLLLFLVLSSTLYGQEKVLLPSEKKALIGREADTREKQGKEAAWGEEKAYTKERERLDGYSNYERQREREKDQASKIIEDLQNGSASTAKAGVGNNITGSSKHELIMAGLSSSISLIDKIQDSLNVTLTLEAKIFLLKNLYELSEQSVSSEVPTAIIERDNESFIRAVFKPTSPASPAGVTQKSDTVKNSAPKKISAGNQAEEIKRSFSGSKETSTKATNLATSNSKQVIEEKTIMDKLTTLFNPIVNLHVYCADYKVQVFIEGIPNFSSETSFVQPVESDKEYMFRYGRMNSFSPMSICKYIARKFPKDQDVLLKFK
jgi:hypothetical protein